MENALAENAGKRSCGGRWEAWAPMRERASRSDIQAVRVQVGAFHFNCEMVTASALVALSRGNHNMHTTRFGACGCGCGCAHVARSTSCPAALAVDVQGRDETSNLELVLVRLLPSASSSSAPPSLPPSLPPRRPPSTTPLCLSVSLSLCLSSAVSSLPLSFDFVMWTSRRTACGTH